MKQENRRKLDAELAKEKLQLFGGLFLLLLIIAIWTGVFYPISTITIYGKIVAITTIHTEEGTKLRVRVKLDSGDFINAAFPIHLRYMRDARGELLERKTFFGRPSYRLIRYAH